MATTSPSTKAPADSTTAHTPDSDKKVKAASVAFNHFSQGKRHLLVGDFKSAVSSFKEATVTLAELYGEQAPECGDAYYHYGHALLELARKEAGVLGPDLDGGSSQEGSTADEDDNEDSQEEEEGSEKKEEEGEEEEDEEDEEEEGDEDKDGENDNEENKEGNDNEDDKEGNKEEKEEENKEGNAEKSKEKKEEEEEDQVTTLQCAWEWLDIARVIFDKQEETPQIAKKRGQIRQSLGEVCMESEDYEGAIREFKECLAIQETVLDKDDRGLAETHYQLGLVHSLSDSFDMAIDHFTAAMEVIRLKIKNLKARIEEMNSWTKEQREKEMSERKDIFYTEEGEIEDLEQLLPDIQHKITDMQEMKQTSMQHIQQAAKAMLLGKGEEPGGSGAFGSGFSASLSGEKSGAPVSKFSEAKPMVCEVRRKRKPEDEDGTEEQKKQKLENGVVGTGFDAKSGSSSVAKPIAIRRKNEKESSGEVLNKAESSTKTKPSSNGESPTIKTVSSSSNSESNKTESFIDKTESSTNNVESSSKTESSSTNA